MLPRDKLDNIDSAPLSLIPERLHGTCRGIAKAQLRQRPGARPFGVQAKVFASLQLSRDAERNFRRDRSFCLRVYGITPSAACPASI